MKLWKSFRSLSLTHKLTILGMTISLIVSILGITITLIYSIVNLFAEPAAEILVHNILATATATTTSTPAPTFTLAPIQTTTYTPTAVVSITLPAAQTAAVQPSLTPSPTATATQTLVPTLSAVILPIETMMYGCQRTIYNAPEGGSLSVLFNQTSSDPLAPEIFGLKWDVSTSKSYAGCTIKIPAGYAGNLQTADYLVIWVQGSPSQAQFEIGLVGCLDPECDKKREWKEKVTLQEEGRQVSFSLNRPELNGERLMIVEHIVLGFSCIFGDGSHTGTLMIGGIGFGP